MTSAGRFFLAAGGVQTFRFPLSALRSRRSRAFTLIEIMVVVALIAALLGTLAVSLRSTGRGSALQAAQRQIASLVAAARAQATLNQTEARLLVYGQQPPSGDAEKFLRFIQLVRSNDAGQWIEVGDPLALPVGVFMVPRTVASNLLATGVRWPTASPVPLSDFIGPSSLPFVNQRSPYAKVTWYYVSFFPDGHGVGYNNKDTGVGQYLILALATAQPTSTGPKFDNPSAIRGILVRPAGGTTFANDPNSF